MKKGQSKNEKEFLAIKIKCQKFIKRKSGRQS